MHEKMKRISSILILLPVLASCNVVELDPNNKYDASYGFKNQANTELYLNSFYPMVYDFGQFGSNALGGNNSNMSDGLTDILKYGSIVAGTGDPNLIMTVDGQQSVSQNYFDSWTACYGWIRKINEFLWGLEEYGGHYTVEQREVFQAEALFFRAYAYFLIMRSHASVKDDLGAILYTDLASMCPETKDRKRAGVEESYDRIRDDVQFAVDHLPEPSAARGRLNRYAADALKARSMLYAGRYSLAREAVQDIMDSGLYGYIEDYSSIFRDLDNREVIWGYGFSTGDIVHRFDQRYSQPGDISDSGSYGGGYAGPTQEFVDSYDYADGTPFDIADESNRFIANDNVSMRDPRLAASVLYNGAIWKGRALECFEGGTDQKYMPYGAQNSPGNTVTGYYMRKLLDEGNTNYILDGSCQPWIEFRYAEMMLIYAECLARENDFSGSREVVAELRKKRFGRDDVYTQPVSDLETALDLILKERCTELCFEGHRFWDLRRTGRAREVLDGKRYSGVLWKRKEDETFVPSIVSCEMGARKYPERFDRFPVPQNEISNNSEAIQNSDW